MKLFRLASLQVLLTILALPALAQTTQPGVVMEYREDKPQRPLKGVEIEVKYAPSTKSNQEGAFSLHFNRLKPGSKVEVRKISKPGYVIYNDNAVKQWNISNNGTAFTILMADGKWFNRVKSTLSDKALADHEKKQKKEIERLERLVKDGQLSLQDKERQLMELEDEYERLKDSIPSFADFVTRINVNECSSQQANIIRSLKEGEIELEEAVKQLRELDLIGAYEKACKAKKELLSQVHVIDRSSDTLLYGIENHIAILKLAGGKDSYNEIGDILKRIALADTTNLERVLDYAQFASQQNLLDDAKSFYEIYCNQIGDNEKWLRSALYLAGTNRELGLYEDAKICYDRIMSRVNVISDTTVKVEISTIAINEYAVMLIKMNQIEEALLFIKPLYENLINSENNSELERHRLEVVVNNYGVIMKLKEEYEKAEVLFRKSIEINQELFAIDSLKYANDLQLSYRSLGLLYKKLNKFGQAEECFTKALGIISSSFKNNPDRFFRDYINLKTDIADCYSHNNKEREAEITYLESINVIDSLIKMRPNVYEIYGTVLYQNVANYYQRQKKPELSIEYINRSLPIIEKKYRMYPMTYCRDLFANYITVSNIQYSVEDFKLAESYLLKAEEIYDKYPSCFQKLEHYALLYNFGYVEIKLKDIEKAISYFEKALILAKDLYNVSTGYEKKLISVNFLLGQCYGETGNRTKAKKLFNDIFDLTKGKEDQYQSFINDINEILNRWSDND